MSKKLTDKLRLRLANLLAQQLKFNTETDKGTLIHAGELAEGVEVFVASENEDPAPAPDGEYIAGDRTIAVTDGKVQSIASTASMEDAPASDSGATIEEVKDLLQEVVDTIVEEIEPLVEEVAEFRAFKERFNALEAKFNATPKATPAATKKPVEEAKPFGFSDLREALKDRKIITKK